MRFGETSLAFEAHCACFPCLHIQPMNGNGSATAAATDGPPNTRASSLRFLFPPSTTTYRQTDTPHTRSLLPHSAGEHTDDAFAWHAADGAVCEGALVAQYDGAIGAKAGM